MNRVFHIAVREFVSTALTKGFIFGGLLLPIVLLAVMAIAMPMLLNEKVPKAVGSVAIIDGTGELDAAIAARFSPDAIEAWQKQRMGEVVEAITKAAEAQPGVEGALETASKMNAAGDIEVEMTVEAIGTEPDEDAIEEAKEPLREGEGMTDGGRLALVVIDRNAVRANGDTGDFGGFQVFVRPKIDDRVVGLIRDQVREVIREARITAAGFETERLEALMEVNRRPTQEVTETGERNSLGELNMLLQFAFMFLLMMSVFVSGQYLLTTTIEEKSSRVIELLLASASPMSLMAGKIFGQMCVGLLLVTVYGALGWGGLLLASMSDLLDPLMIVWFLCFYFIAYTLIASMMAAVGSAVNDLREAQALMTPIMMIVMIPYLLWLPIARDPSSLFATITSFVPGIGPFVMVIRLSSTEPPPLWQVLAAIAVGVVTAYIAVWAAAKVFRVGLLMFGKPPNYATMWKWIKMA
jgi:ABC-2 type transport system permease protein